MNGRRHLLTTAGPGTGTLFGTGPGPRGTTLLELALTLSLLGILLGLSLPRLRQGLDGIAVRGARDALGAGVARARSIGVARGGATLVVDQARTTFWIETGTGEVVGSPVDLAQRYGVRFVPDGAAGDQVILRFDGLGIGRVTSRTFHLRRGRAEARLTLSAYGRPRPW